MFLYFFDFWADFWSPGIRPGRISGVRESDPGGFLESGNPEDGFLDSQVFKITESGRRNHGIRESGNLASLAIADGWQTDAYPAGNHSVHRTLRTLAIANATAQRARGPLISSPFQGSKLGASHRSSHIRPMADNSRLQ